MSELALKTSKISFNQTASKYNEDAAVAYNKSRKYSSTLWKEIQKKTESLPLDGIPGRATSKAISVWQSQNALEDDGKCGAKTLQSLGLKDDSSATKEENPLAHTVGAKVGNIKATKDIVVKRHEIDNKYTKKSRNDIGLLKAGEVASQYLVEGKESQHGRYYISKNGLVGWVNAVDVTPTEEEVEEMKRVEGVNARTSNFKQFDARWGNKIYGKGNNSTYSEGGCGPTSFANIVSKKKGDKYTPDVIGEYFTQIGARPMKSGTNSSYFAKAAAHYGLSCKHYSKSSSRKGLDTMKGASDKYAIVNVGSGKWASDGHFMTIYGFDGTNVYIDDPNTWNGIDEVTEFCEKEIRNGIWIMN